VETLLFTATGQPGDRLQEATAGFLSDVGQNMYHGFIIPDQQHVSQLSSPRSWDWMVSSDPKGQQCLSFVPVNICNSRKKIRFSRYK
jgi:hypothetical protein